MKRLVLLLFVALLAISASTLTACSRKTGCPAYESVKAQTNRKGELSTKKGKSNLFPKEMRKKMK